MDWKELKEFANSLNEKQLEKKVILWREDEAVQHINAECLKDNMYAGEDDDFCIPEDEVEGTLDAMKKVYSVGDPILCENF